jgi:hypothetical protein
MECAGLLKYLASVSRYSALAKLGDETRSTPTLLYVPRSDEITSRRA